MDQTGAAEPPSPASDHGSAPTTPTQRSRDAALAAQKAQNVETHDFTNPTLGIIRNFSRSTSASSLASQEESPPPPLPPRPQLTVLNSRPSTSHSIAHSIAPTRPQLLSKPTTQLSYATFQTRGIDLKDESSTANPRSFLGTNRASHGASDTSDSASLRSYVPAQAAGEAESILGEVMGHQEKSAHEQTLLRSLGHKFVDGEAQSMFPPDPWFEKAFSREFDEIDLLKPDMSNQGQIHPLCFQLTSAD